MKRFYALPVSYLIYEFATNVSYFPLHVYHPTFLVDQLQDLTLQIFPGIVLYGIFIINERV